MNAIPILLPLRDIFLNKMLSLVLPHTENLFYNMQKTVRFQRTAPLHLHSCKKSEISIFKASQLGFLFALLILLSSFPSVERSDILLYNLLHVLQEEEEEKNIEKKKWTHTLILLGISLV